MKTVQDRRHCPYAGVAAPGAPFVIAVISCRIVPLNSAIWLPQSMSWIRISSFFPWPGRDREITVSLFLTLSINCPIWKESIRSEKIINWRLRLIFSRSLTPNRMSIYSGTNVCVVLKTNSLFIERQERLWHHTVLNKNILPGERLLEILMFSTHRYILIYSIDTSSVFITTVPDVNYVNNKYIDRFFCFSAGNYEKSYRIHPL